MGVFVVASILATPVALAHDAGETDEHGVIVVETHAQACVVAVRVDGAFGGPILFELQILEDGAHVTVAEKNLTGTPETEEGEKTGTFEYDFWFDIDNRSHALNVDRLLMSYEETDGTPHSAVEPIELFDCSATPPSSPPPVCADTLRAEARDGGAIFLDWEPATHQQVSFYRVVRDGEEIARTQDSEFLDEGTTPGETYTYSVEAHGSAAAGGTVWTGCGRAEVTAIPFWGSAVLGGVALVGAVGAYAALRRR